MGRYEQCFKLDLDLASFVFLLLTPRFNNLFKRYDYSHVHRALGPQRNPYLHCQVASTRRVQCR
jgi:hypothetical protein